MGDLRIIGGKAREQKIRSVPGDTTRPITDKVREALFNIIGPDIEGATLLDLFAGTGSVGIEALSRGARYVCFIEKSRHPMAIIRQNLETTGLGDGSQVIQSDAFAYLERPATNVFDYVYVAPPQYKSIWSKALHSIDTHSDLLSPDAWVIVQIHPVEYLQIGEQLPVHNLEEFDQRHYGSTWLVFYRQPTIT